jgi:hypothetical protein
VPPLSSISGGACVCSSSKSPVADRLVTETPAVGPIATYPPSEAAVGNH